VADPVGAFGVLAVIVVPAVLLLLAVVAAAFNGALAARAAGRPLVAGLAAPIAESARLLRQQRRTLAGADSVLWRVGSGGLGVAALLKVVVVPIGDVRFVDIPAGVVWFNAMDVLLWALWWLLGWGANSAYSLIGGYRFLAQALSYEIPLMFALTAPAIGAGSLDLTRVVAAQHTVWFILWMPVAFLVYAVSVVAFAAWGPFAVAAGADLAGGVLAELSGPDRLVVLAGRYALLVAGAAFAVPMFLGGGAGPLLPGWGWVLVKTAVLVGVFVTVGRAFPAIRPDRLAEVAWVIVVPLVLLQVLVVAVLAAIWRT
jgi:NADH-quinone oxidoreductase subunit H